jgi:DNA-binding NarL/FixJ family response regulator
VRRHPPRQPGVITWDTPDRRAGGGGRFGAGPPRVVIAEDSVLLLVGLTKLLESAVFEVAATAGEASGLLAAVEREQPHVVIADVRMPPSHTDEGIRAALVIRSQWPDMAILALSQYVEERYAADLLSANTRGGSIVLL